MALSFEESKKLLAQKTSVAAPMVASLSDNAGIMTLESEYETGAIAAYSEWIISPKYEWYEEYTDEKISKVDKNKNITVDASQVNISQEENSQFIPFEMPRYYDGFDLMDADIWFYYLSSDSIVGSRRAVNVSYDTATIKFGWLVDGRATHIAGQLLFEIRAYGANSKGDAYVWKSKTFEGMTVLQSLIDDRVIELDDSWVQELVEKVAESAAEKVAKIQIADQVAAAEAAAVRAEAAADSAEATINTTLEDYYTITEIDQKVENINQKVDNLDGLANFNVEYNGAKMTFYNGQDVMNEIEINSDPSSEWTTAYTKGVEEKIATAKSEVQTDLNAYKATVNADLESIHENIDDLPNTLQSDYYNKEQTNALLSGKADSSVVTRIDTIEADVSSNKTNIQNANSAIALINEALDALDKSPNKTYEAIYNDTSDANGGENVFVLYEITNEAQEDEQRVVKSKFTITGGAGGSASSNTIKIERITTSPLVVTDNDKIIIRYNFIGTDATGDDIGQGNVTWKLGNRVIKTETVYTGENFSDLTEFIDVGSDQKLTLIISDDIGTTQQKIWYVSVVDVKLESNFDDTRKYTAGFPVNFTFTPYGAVDKTIHFLLDGKEIATRTSTKAAATLSDSYNIPAQAHGTHLFEIYMTTTINNNDIESNHIIKDVIWYDEHADVPVIGCVNQEFTARQYESTNITYTVYDPSTETPSVTLKATYVDEDGRTVEEYSSNLVLTTNTNVWQYKTSVIGTHTLTITCGKAVKTLVATVTELGIEINPTTTGLEFDFNPVGYSNNDENRIWKDSNTDVSMSVSDNFDWVNGGYQIDDAGDQYFCIKAGTTATINYNLFADDAKAVGKEFKVIFKTSNIKKRDTSFISCMDNGIGLDMKVESANIYSSNGSLYSPYCEEDIIEFEFNINKSADIPLVLTYEDGVGNRPMIYTSDSSFWQSSPRPITIGSDNCDVHIYRMKSYSTSLSDKDILNNFIADARGAEEMIKRYERNQIYKDGILNPEYLAEKCPDLRIIMIDAPWFTNDKDNKIDDTNITMIYKNGDPVLDNWTCTGARHRGQGTSSNEYGYASRNIDLVMDTDTSLFTLGDGKTTSPTITLTRDSVPTDYLNVKVNVASSENENNAQHARRYNQFNPFVRSAKFNNNKVKDCMEFYNCVVFIRERDEDISTHREFQDTNYHFYSLGNVGDSKKTDDTRMNNKNDPKECIVEITDYNVPLAEFPTGNPNGICAVADWKAGNTAYDHLYSEYEYEDGKFKSFGNKSYEFRYEMKGITEEQRQVNIDNWRDMYKFIVTSTDSEFYARLKEYFVVDSALYYYLYTERYTMVDNRAKNSFWHYGKVYITEAEAETLGAGAGAYIVDNAQAALHDGYRWDLSQGYDFDKN